MCHLPNRILLTKSLSVKLLFGYEAEQFVCFECHFLPFTGYCAYFSLMLHSLYGI